MRLRDGHVSNSSSQSFFIVATAKAYDHVVNEFAKFASKAKDKQQVDFAKLAIQAAKTVRKTKTVGKQELVVVWVNTGEGNDGQFENLIKSSVLACKKRPCSHEIPQGAKFCPECGKTAQEVETDDDWEAQKRVEAAWDAFVHALERDKENASVEIDSH